MKLFNKITIVGVGLMGGSIGLAAKRKKLAKEVMGICRRESSRKKAIQFKAVDKATLSPARGVHEADLVIIAAPVGKIVRLAKLCVKSMKKDAILTDVGSSKEKIVTQIEKIAGKKTSFIGSHPMAGSDKTGVENASADIFDGALVIITKTKKTNKNSLARLRKFWESLGCGTLTLLPKRHDMYASLASYLPHAVSYALSGSQTKNSVRLAAGSLKGTTRVSSADPELWSDIFLSSRTHVLKAIKRFSASLRVLEGAIRRKDKKAVKKFLSNAKRKRDRLTEGRGKT